jgi:hypothetical protein
MSRTVMSRTFLRRIVLSRIVVSRTGRGGVMAGVAALVLVAAGCGSNSAHAAGTTTSSTSTTSAAAALAGCTVPKVTFGTGTAGAPDPTTSVPTDTGTAPINPTNDAGQEVIIAKGGYLLPEWLVAEVAYPITWTNLSGVPQQIVFNDAPVCSAMIPPGGTFSWKSPGFAISLRYHTAHGHPAQLTLQSAVDNS